MQPTLLETFQTYISYKDEQSVYTKKAIGRFKKHIHPFFKDIPVSDINTMKVYEFRKHLEKLQLSPQTVQHHLAQLRLIMNKSATFGYIESSKIPLFDMPKFDNNRVRYLSQQEAQQLLEFIKLKSILWYEITFFAINTGMRVGEIFNLKKENFNSESKIISVLDTKSAKNRMIPLNSNCANIVNECVKKIKNGQYIFNYQPDIKINCVSKIYYNAIKSLGYNDGILDRRNKVCFHTLRHTFASWLVQSGTPLMVVSSLLGHTTTKMTMRYAHLADKQFKEAINSLPTLM